MKYGNNLKVGSERTGKILSQVCVWLVRLLLGASSIIEMSAQRWDIFFINLFAIILTFLPFGIRLALKISFPRSFKIALYFSLLVMVIVEKFLEGWVVFMMLGLLLGIVGFIVMYVIYISKKMTSFDFMIVLFSFCFAVSIGAVWEVFQFLMTDTLKVHLEGFYGNYSPEGLVMIVLGAAFSSIWGYGYLKFSKKNLIQHVVGNFQKQNPNLVSYDDSPEDIKRLIEQGESENLEFKTTLRMNQYTKVKDNRIENSAMKSIAAFLNSSGGNLLIGVSDEGEIGGVEKDKFKNNDGFYKHFSNLVTGRIGNDYLPFIRSSIISMDGGHVMKVVCKQSNKPVFIKDGNKEKFYVRTGPTTQELEGSELISYVNKRFRRK